MFSKPDDESFILHVEYSVKTPALFEISTFSHVLGRFYIRALWRGLNKKCQSFVRDLSFWPALHTPWQFSRKVQGTHHLLCAFWTAGFTARPPDIGSVWCTTIFQVSNRTIVCILKQSASLYGDCMVTGWSQFVW